MLLKIHLKKHVLLLKYDDGEEDKVSYIEFPHSVCNEIKIDMGGKKTNTLFMPVVKHTIITKDNKRIMSVKLNEFSKYEIYF